MNYSTYILEIQEIDGKNIVGKYLNDTIQRCEELNIFCVVEILDEEKDKKIFGGSSTFPYSLFESIADSIVKTKDNNQKERKSIFDGLFSFSKTEQQEHTSYNSIDSDEPFMKDGNKEIDKSFIVNLKNKTEIVRILLKIEDDIEIINTGSGIYELESKLYSRS